MSPFTALSMARRVQLLDVLVSAGMWTRLGEASPEASTDRRALCHGGLAERRRAGQHFEYRATDRAARLVAVSRDAAVFGALGNPSREAAVRLLLDKGPLSPAGVYKHLPAPIHKTSFQPLRQILARGGLVTDETCACGHGRILAATHTARALIEAVDREPSAVTA